MIWIMFESQFLFDTLVKHTALIKSIANIGKNYCIEKQITITNKNKYTTEL
jgi:hypothetical protein